MASNGSVRLRFATFEIDLHTGELWKHGTRIKLVGQPFAILALLVTRPGQLVTREELRDQLWPGDTFGDFDHGLNAAVNKLRDVLCDSPDTPRYIETLPRRGYRFIAEVKCADLANENVVHESLPASEPASISEEWTSNGNARATESSSAVAMPVANASSRTTGRLRMIYLAAGVALVVGGLWFVSHRPSPKNESPHAEIASPLQMVALTTLSDRTSDPAFSPDGNRIAFRRESSRPTDSGIWIKQVGGEALVQLTSNPADCCPVWSPDGRSVAFSRIAEQQRVIYQVPATGGEPRELLSTAAVPEHGELDWSPDGHSIAYVVPGTVGAPAIFLLSLVTRTARQLTMPSALDQDRGPRFSPDGSRLAFIRTQNIMVMAPEGGEVLRLTQESARVLGSPAWAADGQSLVFASVDTEGPSLRRVLATGGPSTRIRGVANLASSPVISKRGFRLACDVLSSARNIEQEDLYPPHPRGRTLVATVTGENSAPRISPDGTKLAFQSDRGGALDIWVSDRDGQNPIQLTAVGNASAPHWSPDGNEIVFAANADSAPGNSRAVFVVKAFGGTSRAVVQDAFSNDVPRWSRDGKWIYFASNRSGDWQIWKTKEWAGSPIQITKAGGFAAEESPDAKYLYYAKDNRDSPELWRIPLAGGSESQVTPPIRPLDWAAWSVVAKGIIFAESGTNNEPVVSLLDFATGTVQHLTVLDKPPFWITAVPDAKTLIFDHPAQEDSHVMLIENFR